MKHTPKNLSGFALLELLILIMIGAVLVGGAYYVGKNRGKSSNANSLTSATIANKQQSGSIPANWKVYFDKSLGIKLSHPANWKISSDRTTPEPFVGDEFGANHKFYGSLDAELVSNDALFPALGGLVFGKESITYDQLVANATKSYQSVSPFKAPRQAENFNLRDGGRGIMLNQVTSDYSDLIFYLDVGNKLYRFSFREQTVASGGSPATDYTKYSDVVIKIVKSLEAS